MKINHLHETCLRIVYSDRLLVVKQLSETGRSHQIHTLSLKECHTGMLKIYKNDN